MKKLYTMLLGLILAMGANAADIYLRGDISGNGWSANPAYKFTTTDNENYTLELASLSGQFKIADANWGSINYGGNYTIQLDTDYTLTYNGSNLKCGQNFTDVVVTFNLTTKVLRVTGQAHENEYDTVYIIGNINGSGWKEDMETYPMTLKEGTNNVWETSITTTTTSYFKMRAGSFLYGTGIDNDITPVSGQEYTAEQSGNSFIMASGKTYDISFTLDKNADTGSLVVTYDGGDDPNPDDPETDYSKWYVNILGDFNGWKDNGLNPVEGISTHTDLAIGTSSFKVKIWNGAEDVWYASTTGNVPVGEWFQFEKVAGDGTPIEGAKASSVYNVEYNVITNQIKVTLVSENPDEPDPEPNYDSWYVNILGDFNEWKDNGVNPVDGISTHTDLAIGTSSFKVKIWNGSKDEWYASANGNVPVGEWFQFELVAGDGTPIEGAKASSVYNVEYNVITNQVKVTLVSEEPDPVEQPLDVTFDFTNIETIQAMNSAIPALADWTKDQKNTKFALEDITLVSDNVSISAIKDPESTATSISISSLYRTEAGVIDLRFYKNNLITLAAPEGYYVVNFELKTLSTVKLNKLSSKQGTFTATTEKDEDGFYVATFEPNADNAKAESIVFTVSGTQRVSYLNVTLAKLDETPEVHETLYLRAADNSWGADESNEMAYENGVYSITMAKLAGAFKIANSDYTVQATTCNLAMETGVSYEIAEFGELNMGMKDVLENVTVTYDSTSKKVQVTGTAVEGYSVSYMLHGQFEAYVEPETPENPEVPEGAPARAEAAWNDIEMTENNGIISAVVVPLAEEGSFVIFHKRDGVDYETIKSASGTLSADQTLQLTAQGGEDAKYQLNPDHKYTLEVDTNTLVASTRDGGSTGIESITVDADTDIRYFNLQGVPVATPAPGLYIVVRNGVATKAYIR